MNQLIWLLLLFEMELAFLVNGSLRITAGYAVNAGRLEFFYNGEWGTVCDNHFDNIDATVACRQLGYCSGIIYPADRIRDGQGAIWLNDVHCTGSESKLLHCAYNADSTRCRHYDDVGIHCFLSCSTEEDGGLRITAGYAEHQGRLEIKYRGEWGQFVIITLGMLMQNSGIMQPADRIHHGTGAIWLNDVNCSGSESILLDCNFNNVTYKCDHRHDVGVHCFLNCSTEDTGDLRITAGYAKHQGRLEIKYRGEWGTVCRDNFENVDAEIACKQLGYCSGIMQPAKMIHYGYGAIWLNEVNCSGFESKLLDCNFNNVTLQCDHWDDIGIHCFLNCSAEDEGRVTLRIKDDWKLSIEENGEQFVKITLGMLMQNSGIMQPRQLINHGYGAIWLNDVNCSGSESKLLDCDFNNVTLQCDHWYDIGVHCFLNCSTEDEGDLRIRPGYANHQGRLEIKYRGEWGTVCQNHFGNVDAEVACRQLGYCSGIMQPRQLINHGYGAIWLNDVNCSGSESKLLDCDFNKVTLQCDHWYDIGVHCFLNCSTEDEGDLRIRPGYANHQGRLEIKYRGEWETVYHFGNVDAEVACRQLGYCSGIMQPRQLINHGYGAIWLNDVNCSGSESKLLDCDFNKVTLQCDHCFGIMQPRKLIRDEYGAIWLNDVNCYGSESKLLDCNFNNDTLQCDHRDDVGIHCFLNCSTEDEGILRITAGYAKNQGRLEINYRGEWGTVCGNHFANVDAEIACKQLGYCSGIMQPANLIRHGKGAIWLNDVNCSGSESKLLDCNFNNVTFQCDHFWNDVGIHCFLNCSTEDEVTLSIKDDWKLSTEVNGAQFVEISLRMLMQK
ncbi:unnamed protein product [Mytilus edulis]|uniref:SRCR domain-containing protein n=1 Tax=Mytilus edulis TaxID=6550 RepID=A0A8S3Q3C5_MYTED|nr:unnamed protein product [Mytilus edulis]